MRKTLTSESISASKNILNNITSSLNKKIGLGGLPLTSDITELYLTNIINDTFLKLQFLDDVKLVLKRPILYTKAKKLKQGKLL